MTTTSTAPAPPTGIATPARPGAAPALSDPVAQAYWLLRIAFITAPILFGLDKFAHVLVNWDKYLAPEFTDLFNAQAHTLMYAVGAIEIVAGLVVALPSALRRLSRRGLVGRHHRQSVAARRLLRRRAA